MHCTVFPWSLLQSHSLIRCGAACHTATKRKWLYRLFTIDDHNPVIGRMPKTVFDACCLLRGDSWSLAPTSWHISNGKDIPIGTFQIHGPIILLVHSTSTVTANRTWWQGGQTIWTVWLTHGNCNLKDSCWHLSSVWMEFECRYLQSIILRWMCLLDIQIYCRYYISGQCGGSV